MQNQQSSQQNFKIGNRPDMTPRFNKRPNSYFGQLKQEQILKYKIQNQQVFGISPDSMLYDYGKDQAFRILMLQNDIKGNQFIMKQNKIKKRLINSEIRMFFILLLQTAPLILFRSKVWFRLTSNPNLQIASFFGYFISQTFFQIKTYFLYAQNWMMNWGTIQKVVANYEKKNEIQQRSGLKNLVV